MHIDKVTRRAYNIEPNMCWECYSCVKACPHHAIDVRGYADFAPLGHSVRVIRDEEKGVIAWRIKFRNGKKDMNLLAPIIPSRGASTSRSSRMCPRHPRSSVPASCCSTNRSTSEWTKVTSTPSSPMV
jgi:adenosine phosphosulfate reductase beta subunit